MAGPELRLGVTGVDRKVIDPAGPPVRSDRQRDQGNVLAFVHVPSGAVARTLTATTRQGLRHGTA
jgi:hypothetical protein